MESTLERLLALIEMDQSKPDLKWINAIPINKNTSSLALVVAFKILETRGLGFKDWWKNSYRGKILDECKFCGREGTITMIPKSGRYLTGDDCEAGKFVHLMSFDCRGLEPVDYSFGGDKEEREKLSDDK